MSNLLNDVMIDGRILVFLAGTLPYYYNGYAIDALGKSDKYIASLLPDYSVAFNGTKRVPGHAKHAMDYSMHLKPDFQQTLSFFGDDYTRVADENYVAIKYKGKWLELRITLLMFAGNRCNELVLVHHTKKTSSKIFASTL